MTCSVRLGTLKPSVRRTFQRNPSSPAVMEPPDTDDIRSSRSSHFASASLHRAPQWNSVALKPPPESASPMPSESPSDPNGIRSLSRPCVARIVHVQVSLLMCTLKHRTEKRED